MGNRQTRKTEREMREGELVAQALNKAGGTDYEAVPASQEPADVTLRSISGRFPTRQAQVVSIPLDFRSRDDKHTLIRIETTLEEMLRERDIHHMLVGIFPSSRAEMHGAPRKVVERLADLIEKEGRNRDISFSNFEMYERDPVLAEMFDGINISHHPGFIENVEIDIPRGGSFPRDGRWIQQGILKKLVKYGGAAAVKDLVLIIGVAGFVDDRQVAAFLRGHPESDLPFAEIWINTTYHGTYCLKKIKNIH